jgi:hypothetical protein
MSTSMGMSGVGIDTRLLKVGGTLASAGMLLAATGAALVSVAVSRAARAWMKQRDPLHPVATAGMRVQQAKGASAAGIEAWHAARRAASDHAGSDSHG